MFDTHCHLDLPAFAGDRAAVLTRAHAAGVTDVLIPAVHPAGWAALTALCAELSPVRLRLALGVHPQVVPELTLQERRLACDPDQLGASALAARAVAIGECGLDGGTEDRDEQERVFRAHVRAARAARLPLVVHVLRAHDLTRRVLREENAREVGGVLHSYSGGAALVPIYRDLGFCFSFAGPVTYPGARRPVEAARAVPADLLLAETDAPDQSPALHRGGRCEPAYVADVIAGLARARGEPASEVAALTAHNAHRLFGTG